MRAESHLREEPWDSGLSQAILNPLGATAACEAFFFFLERAFPSHLVGDGEEVRVCKPEPSL